MRLDLSSETRADLRDVHVYSESIWGAVRAGDYLDNIADRLEALARGDLSGTSADDVRPGLRRQVAGSHVIWFRVEGDTLRVIRVLHQSRDAGRWMG